MSLVEFCCHHAVVASWWCHWGVLLGSSAALCLHLSPLRLVVIGLVGSPESE